MICEKEVEKSDVLPKLLAYNIDYCKKLFNMVDELRHLDGFKGV